MNFKITSAATMLLTTAAATHICEAKQQEKTNFVVIFCDDMGYGDLSCYGHPTISTPHLDRMAAEGQKWSNFYVGASVSSPSRGALLTGRYGVKSGLYGDKRRVIHPPHVGGIQPEEKTIAEYMQDGGYTTACVGKWHIGHHEGQLPFDNGFDNYYGIPYSSDMSVMAKKVDGKNYKWKMPFYDYSADHQEIEYEPDQTHFTEQLTDYAIDFMDENRKNPFFLYLAHPMPHYPLFPGADFKDSSKRGLYGDVVEEIDYNVGRILDYLRESKLDENTVVIFTSDNGPWLIQGLDGGSAGLLREGKASMFEGGFRVPAIFWGKGVKPGSLVTDLGSTLDLLPTFCSMADIPLLTDREYDGFDITETLKSETKSPREVFFYYRGSEVYGVRKGAYKLLVNFKMEPYYDFDNVDMPLPWLFNVEEDPSESENIAADHPEIVAELQAIIDQQVANVAKTPSQFDREK